MDTLRSNISGLSSSAEGDVDYDRGDDEIAREAPPLAIGTDDRRMQVRAYNFWASLLVDRNLPSIEDLDPDKLPDFGPNSVLLDFSSGVENPSIVFLGDKLAAECGGSGPIRTLADVPSRSLLSRITDHHMQIIANQAPIGFEAEFINQHGVSIMYRGILLPFSSDNDTIDFIFGVINWKELADQQTTDELLLEIEMALEPGPESNRLAGPLTEWADGPVETGIAGAAGEPAHDPSPLGWPPLTLVSGAAIGDSEPANLLPQGEATFGLSLNDGLRTTLGNADPRDMALADWLASARDCAQTAKASEDRTRSSLYAAIGRAYDFALAAAAEPEAFAELVTDAGLTVQERAPLIPLLKLVFGADYDKTRLTEFATVIGHGQRLGLGCGAMTSLLVATPGGLKRLVAEERRLRRDAEGVPAAPRQAPGERLARKLRKLDHAPLAEVAGEGSEFTLLVARRMPDGQVVLLGEVGDDVALLERAARRLID